MLKDMWLVRVEPVWKQSALLQFHALDDHDALPEEGRFPAALTSGVWTGICGSVGKCDGSTMGWSGNCLGFEATWAWD